jgi:hypothetical protein
VSDLYTWLVFIHVASAFIFFLAHGASAGMAFKLRTTRDRAGVQALLDMSRTALLVFAAALLVTVLAGIILGFMGGYWGELWIWISIALLVVVFVGMTPIAAGRLRGIRALLAEEPTAERDAEIMAALDAWNPMPSAVLGIGGLLVITWFMFFRPF